MATSSPSREACFETYYENDAHNNGVDHALALIDMQIKREASFGGSCHLIMHQIGHAAAHEYGTLGEAFMHGNNDCQNGYYHGVVEEFFKNDDPNSMTISDLRNFCNGVSNISSSSNAELNCVHGVGHALIYMTGDDLPRSLLRCGDFATDITKSQCATGAFMQHSFDLVNNKSASNELRNDPAIRCAQSAGDQDGCWLALSASTISNKGTDLSRADQFCNGISNVQFKTQCHDEVVRTLISI